MEKETDPLTHEIIGGAIAVSKYWGNAVLEKVYKRSLAIELHGRGLSAPTEVPIPGAYGSVEFDIVFKADLIVNQAVIVEAKAVSTLLDVYRHQLLTYMRLAEVQTGLLFNFHAYPFTKNGIVRLSL